jgi:hypothetical protein
MSNTEPIYEHDANGRCICVEYSAPDKYTAWYAYDAAGDGYRFTDSDGIEEYYDSDGNPIEKPQG